MNFMDRYQGQVISIVRIVIDSIELNQFSLLKLLLIVPRLNCICYRNLDNLHAIVWYPYHRYPVDAIAWAVVPPGTATPPNSDPTIELVSATPISFCRRR